MGRRFLATCGKPPLARLETASQSSVGKSGKHTGLGGETNRGTGGSVSTMIREAERSELPEVLGLLEECGLPNEGVEEHLDSFLVARENQALVGAIGLECYGDAGLLRSLAVRVSERGRGLGARLVEALSRRAKERGINTIYLLTESAEDFFPRFGFERIPREGLDARLEASKELHGVCPDSATAMRRSLP